MRFALGVAFVVILTPGHWAAKPSIDNKVRDFMSAAMDSSCWRNKYNPGVTVAVVKDGAKVFADGFGKKDGTDAASSRPTEHTLFGIASVTKGFTAALLVKMMDEQKYDTITSNKI